VTEAEVSAEPNFTLVEVLRENTLEPVLTIDTPSVDALGRFVWTAQDTSGLLDITDNPSGADQKYFIRISRRADADDVDVRFWAAWETPLTWLFGPALQGSRSSGALSRECNAQRQATSPCDLRRRATTPVGA
jgi:hypothetical protein